MRPALRGSHHRPLDSHGQTDRHPDACRLGRLHDLPDATWAVALVDWTQAPSDNGDAPLDPRARAVVRLRLRHRLRPGFMTAPSGARCGIAASSHFSTAGVWRRSNPGSRPWSAFSPVAGRRPRGRKESQRRLIQPGQEDRRCGALPFEAPLSGPGGRRRFVRGGST